jgi:hypothetical protein
MRVEAVLGAVGAGTTRYDACGGAASGDGLRGVEFAGLLSGLRSCEVDYALAVYLQDVDAQVRLRAHVQVFAIGLAVERGWEVVRGRPTISNLATLAVFSVVSPGVCGCCGGTGLVVGRACGSCNGVGRFPMSGRDKAEFLMVDNANWLRLWRGRYALVSGYVNGLDSAVRGVVYKNSEVF